MKTFRPSAILAILDRSCDHFTFPMMDNGYVYPAATRLTLYRSPDDWAMVIEEFGFSPRAGLPDTTIQTYASRLHRRDRAEDYVSREAYQNYLKNNPHNEHRSAFPIRKGDWQHPDESEYVTDGAKQVRVRGTAVPLPRLAEYAKHGIVLEDTPRVCVFELCRYLAAVERERVLATPKERRVSVLPEMKQLLALDEWHHPDLVNDERPGESETFWHLAKVLSTGDVSEYHSTTPPNTHWRNWPEGGTL